MLIGMSLWINIRQRPFTRVLPIVVCRSDFISRNAENDNSPVVKEIRSVANTFIELPRSNLQIFEKTRTLSISLSKPNQGKINVQRNA